MMHWRLAVIPATTIPIILIAIRFDIDIIDVFTISAVPIVFAASLLFLKLVISGLKFSYIVRSNLGKFDSIWRMTGVRIGSEFIKFTTPMFIGAEFVVIYWLHKKNVPTPKALWIAILDIVTEVLAGGVLSIAAGLFALYSGAYLIATVILATSISITTLWVVLFFLSSTHTFQLPGVFAFILRKTLKTKSEKYIKETNKWMSDVCHMSRENLHKSSSKKIFVNSFFMSLAAWLCYGLSFLIIAVGIGYDVSILDSIMSVMGANAIANLPITVGGSGLVEFGVIAYLNDLNPFDPQIAENAAGWNAVVAWRIATYYIPIAITWLFLMKLALVRYNKPSNIT